MAELYRLLLVVCMCSWALADGGNWNEQYPYPPSITQEVPPPPAAAPETYGPPPPPATYGTPAPAVVYGVPAQAAAPVVYEAYDANKLHYGSTDGGYGPPPNLIAHANHPSYFTGAHLAHVGYWIGAVWDKIITFLEPFAFLGLIANGIYVVRLMLPPFFFGTLTPQVLARKGKNMDDDVDSSEWYFRQLISSISDTVCTQRVACKSGLATAPFLASSSQRMMKNLRKLSPKFGSYTDVVSIYLDAASGSVTDCAQYTCENKRQHSTAPTPDIVSNPTSKDLLAELGLALKAMKKPEGNKSKLEQEASASSIKNSDRLDLSKNPRKFSRK